MQAYSTQKTTMDRLFGWWYAIAAPPAVAPDAPLQDRELARRARFTSIVILIEVIFHISTVGAKFSPQVLTAVVITIIALLVGAVLNRLGKTRAAGILILITLEAGMCLGLISSGFTGGFSPFGLTQVTILLQPDLIAISLFPVIVALPVCLFNCLFTVAIILLLPKTPDMLQLLATSGTEAYFLPLSTIITAPLVILLWVSSANQEMRRADRAEEVNKLIQALANQQQNALQEKQQLEESIQQIVAVHTQIANGNFNARVPLDQKNVLWSIAGSLNNLLSRLQRWRQEAQQQQIMERAIQQALNEIRQAKQQGRSPQPRLTGTPLDPLLAELATEIFSTHSSYHPRMQRTTSTIENQ